MVGLREISVAAGAFFTVFIARPNDALEHLPLYPEDVASYDGCIECLQYREGQAPVMCDKVKSTFYSHCCIGHVQELIV